MAAARISGRPRPSSRGDPGSAGAAGAREDLAPPPRAAAQPDAEGLPGRGQVLLEDGTRRDPSAGCGAGRRRRGRGGGSRAEAGGREAAGLGEGVQGR